LFVFRILKTPLVFRPADHRISQQNAAVQTC